MLTDEECAQIMSSPLLWGQTCVMIENKQKDLIHFDPNVMQVRMTQVYETMQALERPTRMIVLKPRQSGGSTFATMLSVHHCKRYKARGVFMADDYGNSMNLYRMAERHCQTDAFPWEIKTIMAKGEIRFSNGSMLEQDTANNPKAGISATRQVAHLSEVARYPSDGIRDSYVTITNMLASVNKKGPNSLVIMESTPAAPSGFFYDTWVKSVTLEQFVSGETGNGWIKVFAGWHEFPEHSKEVSQGEAEDILATLTPREKRGVKLYNWTPEQIAWYRETLHSECGGDERMMSVHYPEDEESGWLASGSPRFDPDGMLALQLLAKSEMQPTYGFITSLGDTGGVAWSQRAKNEASLQMYEEPREGCRYLLIVDPATGASYTRGADPDAHGVIVLRAGYKDENGIEFPTKVVMMAKSPCRWDVDVLAKIVIRMSKYYGKCLVVPERNMGIALIEQLKDKGVSIYNEEVVDHLTSKTKNILGWETNKENRNRCISRLAALIRQSTTQRPEILLPEEVVEECKTFVVDNSGRAAAAAGRHDDLVMATAIGVQCLESATTLRPMVRTRRAPADRHLWKPVSA